MRCCARPTASLCHQPKVRIFPHTGGTMCELLRTTTKISTRRTKNISREHNSSTDEDRPPINGEVLLEHQGAQHWWVKKKGTTLGGNLVHSSARHIVEQFNKEQPCKQENTTKYSLRRITATFEEELHRWDQELNALELEVHQLKQQTLMKSANKLVATC